jgi:hypothetical protein
VEKNREGAALCVLPSAPPQAAHPSKKERELFVPAGLLDILVVLVTVLSFVALMGLTIGCDRL